MGVPALYLSRSTWWAIEEWGAGAKRDTDTEIGEAYGRGIKVCDR
jgi:hypothetical protein